MNSSSARQDTRRFIERFALLLTEGGMPRMPARVFACVLCDDAGRMTATQLAQQLEVSPAAISGAVRYLVQVRLLHKGREPGARSDHYALTDDLWYTALLDRTALLESWESGLSEGIKAVGARSHAGRRLGETQAFFAFLREEMPQLLDRWKRRQTPGASRSNRRR